MKDLIWLVVLYENQIKSILGVFLKRHGNLWNKITDYDNLYIAYVAASKGKHKRAAVIEFEKNVEENLKKIQTLLVSGQYTTSQYTNKTIYIPKERTIYKLPFAPDRIVQHALLQILIPIWDKMMIHDSYSCRKGKGIHKASKKVSKYVKQYKYCLKTDISKFYPSINHDTLLFIIKKKIKCKHTLILIEDIIRSFPGDCNIPIGNYTSQWFGNLYLNELDQYIKQMFRVKPYIRYSDDIVIFSNCKRHLKTIKDSIESFLCGIKLKFSKWCIIPVAVGVDFVGYKHYFDAILLRRSTCQRVIRRLVLFKIQSHNKFFNYTKCAGSLCSSIGWLSWATHINKYILKLINDLIGAINERLSKIYQHQV